MFKTAHVTLGIIKIRQDMGLVRAYYKRVFSDRNVFMCEDKQGNDIMSKSSAGSAEKM